MTLQARHLSSRLLLILALVAALLAGLVAIQWATSHSNLTHAFVSTPGGDSGGGGIRWAGVPGGDGGGGKHRDTGAFSPAGAVGGDSGGGK